MNIDANSNHAIITGGSRGIGFACASKLAIDGYEVTLVARDEINLKYAQKKIESKIVGSSKINYVKIDLSKSNDRVKIIPFLERANILVTCAGSIPGGNLSQLRIEDWIESWSLKVFGYIHMTKMALEVWPKRQRSVILHVIGYAGEFPQSNYICGSVANAALSAFVKAMARYAANRESDGFRTRIVGLNPGPTKTDRLISLYEQIAISAFGDAKKWMDAMQDLPYGQPATPEEIANVAAFLVSERASYMNGCVINVDGGFGYS